MLSACNRSRHVCKCATDHQLYLTSYFNVIHFLIIINHLHATGINEAPQSWPTSQFLPNVVYKSIVSNYNHIFSSTRRPWNPASVLPSQLVHSQILKVVTTCSEQILNNALTLQGPSLWSSGQSSWLQIQRSLVRFPALPDFLRSSGSGTESTQPREYNWGATWTEK
jgi:hypothetical protein